MNCSIGYRSWAPTIALTLATLLVSCTSSSDGPTPSVSPSPSDEQAASASPSPSPRPDRSPHPRGIPPARLAGALPCTGAPGFVCSTLRVPLDWSGQEEGTLDLPVAVAEGEADDPVLLVLSGGPGQPGVEFVTLANQALAPVVGDYRLVMLDQRGTGANAIDCPPLQAAVGGSDILAPPPAAVRTCARRIGLDRAFLTTEDTVADLDHLRRALAVKSWALDGISYGTFVAERYAIEHPDRVEGLILDSAVPHNGLDPFLRENLRRTAYVLRDVCKSTPCDSDPAKDLASVVRQGGDGVGILNALTLQSIFDPTFRELADVPALLHQARLGDPSALDDYVAEARRLSAFSANELSAGLHAATLCSDLRFPWDENTSIDKRRRDLRRATKKVSKRAVWPFDRATAAGNGVIQTCVEWPRTAGDPVESRALPDVPVLLLHGERDLSTPLVWAREVARSADESRLVVLPDDGHSTQFGEGSERPVEEIGRFLSRL
ncbi:MAG: alpha/beta hydrolase [Actinomycetota bacterium]|nr:alpha/beta hydrolase [Actinomycetota bacterium]